MATSRRSWVVVGAAVLALAAVTVLLLRGRTDILSGGSDGDSARLRALEVRVAFLEARLRGRTIGGQGAASTREAQLAVPVAAEQASGSEPGSARATAPSVTRSVELDEAALEREYFGELDARLATETRDPLWSAATEERLRGSTQELRSLISVDAAQCGSSLCRVDTTVLQLQDEARALDKFLSAAIAVLPDAVVREGDQPGRRVVYFSRNEGGFPPMAAAETASP